MLERTASGWHDQEIKMKSSFLETFLLGVTLGVGMTVLALYTQKPGLLATAIENLAQKGRARRARQEEEKFLRGKLKGVGFFDEEIDQFFGRDAS